MLVSRDTQRCIVRGTKPCADAAPIPVVLKKCAMCHENYNDFKANEPIGALSYTIAVE